MVLNMTAYYYKKNNNRNEGIPLRQKPRGMRKLQYLVAITVVLKELLIYENCNQVYAGQTSRELHERFTKHRATIR